MGVKIQDLPGQSEGKILFQAESCRTRADLNVAEGQTQGLHSRKTRRQSVALDVYFAHK